MSKRAITAKKTSNLILIKYSEPFPTRLDKFLSEELKISRHQVQSLIQRKKVVVGTTTAKSSYKLSSGEVVNVALDIDQTIRIEPKNLKIPRVYEDSSIAVYDKPAGVSVHPKLGNLSEPTIVSDLLFRYPNEKFLQIDYSQPLNEQAVRPGIVHRLDKFTSGLLVVSKNQASFLSLKSQFQERKVKKHYLALVGGLINQKSGFIENKIGRDPQNYQRFMVTDTGKEAYTEYEVAGKFQFENQIFTLVSVFPRTGRTHQIRVHFAFQKHPLVGDKLYKGSNLLDRVFLHAYKLQFKHPESGNEVEFTSELPANLSSFLKKLTPI